jgi:putative inorganic carbon (hco3(-)) transporter
MWIQIFGMILVIICLSLVPYRYVAIASVPSFLVRFFPLFAISFFSILALLRTDQGKWHLGKDRLFLPVFAVLVIDMLSGLGGIDPFRSLQKTAYYFLTGPLVYFLIRRNIGEFPDSKKLYLWTISISSVLAASYGVSEFYRGINWLFSDFLSLSNPHYSEMVGQTVFPDRILGTIGHPVIFGAFLLLCLPATIFLTCKGGNCKKGIGILFCGLIIYAIFLTFSRGAWVGLAAGVFFYGIFFDRRLFMIVLLGLIILGILILSSARIQEIVKSRDPYRQYVLNFRHDPRIKAYSYVTQVLPESIYWGSGVGTYRYLAKPLGSKLDTPDNMYLVRLVETGVVGVIAFFFLLGRIISSLKKNVMETRCGRALPGELGPFLLAGIVGFLIDMMSFDALYFPAIRTMFWIVIGIGCSNVAVEGVKAEVKCHEDKM